MNRDLLSGIVLLAIAALYFWASGTIADSTLSDEVGAAGLPRILTAALALLGLIIIARSFFTRPAAAVEEKPDGDEEADARWPRAFGFLLFGAAYVALLPLVGYIVGVTLLIGAIALYEGAPRRWPIPVAALGGAVLYWGIFVKLLGVRQPTGILFQTFLG